MIFEMRSAVVLTEDIPDEGLFLGDVGILREILEEDRVFVVEFFSIDGQSVSRISLGIEFLRSLRPGEAMGLRTVIEGIKLMNVVEVDRGPRVA